MSSFVLIHSPLTGPQTWQLVAQELTQRGQKVITPTLTSPPGLKTPYWEHHAGQVAAALKNYPADQRVILVGHSGAGVLLPAIRRRISQPASRYIFVDAEIPQDGKSRLDLFEDEPGRQTFRASAVDGLLPTWSDADLRDVIPNSSLRTQFIQELQPLPIQVYEESIPVFPGWPDAPCGFLRFGENPAYDQAAEQAQSLGWQYLQLTGIHFHMLVDPSSVAEALLQLTSKMGVS